MSKYSPVADLKVKVREYVDKTGATKSYWLPVGTLWENGDSKSQYITIDALPTGVLKDGARQAWDGYLFVFSRETTRQDRPLTQHEVLSKAQDVVLEDIDDKKEFSVDEIPF